MAYFTTSPPPTIVPVSRDHGWQWKVYVPLNHELVISASWGTTQLLQCRIVSGPSFNAWSTGDQTQVDTWARFYGSGAIRGAFVPPVPGWWIVLMELPSSVPTALPPPLLVAAVVHVREATT